MLFYETSAHQNYSKGSQTDDTPKPDEVGATEFSDDERERETSGNLRDKSG